MSVAAGAAGVLATRPVEVPAVVVADTVLALGRLARLVVSRLALGSLSVVGVTGSQGKTSTKATKKAKARARARAKAKARKAAARAKAKRRAVHRR